MLPPISGFAASALSPSSHSQHRRLMARRELAEVIGEPCLYLTVAPDRKQADTSEAGCRIRPEWKEYEPSLSSPFVELQIDCGAGFAAVRLGDACAQRDPLPSWNNGPAKEAILVFFIDDGPGKAVGIDLFIGKRPIAAFGNSSGDAEMLQWTQAGPGARLMMLVYHDDATREYAYGPAGGLPETHVGTFPEELMAQAKKDGWVVISMQKDWKRIFPFDK